MQTNTFSKRKTKTAGLCGAILATATLAVGLSSTVQADQNSKTAQATSSQKAPTFTVDTQTVQAPAASSNQSTTAATPAQEPTTNPVARPQMSSATVAAPAATAVPAQSSVASPAEQQAAQPVQSANVTVTKPATAASTAASTKPANTTEIGKVDYDKTLSSAQKIAPVTDITYSGTADEYITVENPGQAYKPNAENITKYLNEYLTELRNINGINVPVPEANDLMKDFAQSRASEEANENDGIDHQTKSEFPSSVKIYSENGHEDTLSSIAPQNGAGQTLGSDKATAYYLALNWFADYFNIMSGEDGKSAFGHAISILSNSGEGMSLGVATNSAATSNFYAMLEIGSNTDVRNEDGFTATQDANGNYVLNYNGQKVKFLPKTTFHYVTPSSANAEVAANNNRPANNNNNAAADNTPAKANTPARKNTPAAGDQNQNPANANQADQERIPVSQGEGDPSDLSPYYTATAASKETVAKQTATASGEKQDGQLPETGDAEVRAGITLGATFALVGLGLAFKRKSED